MPVESLTREAEIQRGLAEAQRQGAEENYLRAKQALDALEAKKLK